MGEEYDVVVVGGGSAGCALAGRLAAARACRVLLLEAGPVEWTPEILDVASLAGAGPGHP
ncbi:MAG TPA: lycopene cyclase family protein, partial [Pseudonocardia sp.]|nr:lycopene cyclase family protein [Pseudonocardia sp.]